MVAFDASPRMVQVRGEDSSLVELLSAPLAEALEERRNVYVVEVAAVGRGEQILVCINGNRGRLPLLFQKHDLKPSHVLLVVKDAVDQLGI
jgi:hypothetical protein